jgi:hypothetical protein
MPLITDVVGLSSELTADFDNVIELEVELREEAKFGDLYECLAIDGWNGAARGYLVKIFKDDGYGSERQCFATVQKLQRRVVAADGERGRRGAPGIASFPALSALPQFSFLGVLNGRQVLGYAMKKLDSAGYVPFAKVLEEVPLRERYRKLSLEDRLYLCYELAEGFRLLSDEMSFIHADLNPPNFFVNLDDCHLALIDFDSGAVTEHRDDTPGTFGKTTYGEWLAPEISDQVLAQRGGAGPTEIKVDRFTDTWAVAIAIHHLLFLCHPMFFLGSLGVRMVREYLAARTWPALDAGEPWYDKVNGPRHGYYLDQLKTLPDPVRQKLASTLNQGYSNPSQRASYSQWSLILRATQPIPAIDLFAVDRRGILPGMRVELTWSVKGAHQVSLSPGIGEVDPAGSLAVFPSQHQTYTLVARARSGIAVQRSLQVWVYPAPRIGTLLVPAPRLAVQLNVGQIRIAAPRVELPVRLNLALRLQDRSLAGPPPPLARRLQHIVSPSFPAGWRFRIESVFRQWKERIDQLAGGTH